MYYYNYMRNSLCWKNSECRKKQIYQKIMIQENLRENIKVIMEKQRKEKKFKNIIVKIELIKNRYITWMQW